jgi:hypothetical protein
MHFIYIDDSTERPLHVFSGLCVPCAQWNEAFSRLKKWREHLRDTHGLPLNYELHARKFLSGRNTGGAIRDIPRHKRAQIFYTAFKVTNWLNGCGVTVFNVAHNGDDQYEAFERLLNRINRTMKERETYCHLICDEGKNEQYTKLFRRMRVHNFIPSKYGAWEDGKASKNIPIDRIIEDPQFKSSARSYFVQQADFTAFGLLRREVPKPRLKRHGVHRTFNVLKPETLELVCNPADEHGVIR